MMEDERAKELDDLRQAVEELREGESSEEEWDGRYFRDMHKQTAKIINDARKVVEKRMETMNSAMATGMGTVLDVFRQRPAGKGTKRVLRKKKKPPAKRRRLTEDKMSQAKRGKPMPSKKKPKGKRRLPGLEFFFAGGVCSIAWI